MKKLTKLMVCGLCAGTFAFTSCTPTQEGAFIGGALGTGVGAAIGSNNGNTARGALIGGALGAGGGALIGSGNERAYQQGVRDSQHRHDRW